MLITKPSVTGIDIKIQELQSFLYPKIKAIWGLTDSTYTSYGRAYRNQTEDGYSPEVYVNGIEVLSEEGTTYLGVNEYKDVYFDDTVSASSFFGTGEAITVDKNKTEADVFLIFMVNLSKIKPAETRNDEEAHIDMQRIVTRFINGFTFTGLITGIDQVFKEYSGWKKKEGIKYRDMHPLHCFRLNFKLLYNPFLNCQ